MLKALEIPPGFVRAGTQYQSKGYWFNGNLIRFFERSIRPVGGWEKIVTLDSGGPPRGLHAWRSNDSIPRLILGTGSKVWAYADGALTDITPNTFGAPTPDPPANTPKAWGDGIWGDGFWGTNNPETPPSDPTDEEIPLVEDDDATWTFDNFGQYPVGVMSSDRRVRYWNLDTAENFDVVATGAPLCRAVVVTPERFILALGTGRTSKGYLVFADQVEDGDTVTIGDKTYTFVPEEPTADGDVLIGDSIEASITNLAAAINLSPGAGSLYGESTTLNADVSATVNAASFNLIVAAKADGEDGNGIALSVISVSMEWTEATTLGGDNSTNNVRWPSRETLDKWEPTNLNTAGDHPLATTGRPMNGKRLPRETLIWTDADLHSAVYIGGEFVYTFEWRGDKCGALSPNSMAVIGDVAFWMGDNAFFRYDGAVNPLPCDVQDYVFSRLNKTKAHRVTSHTVSQYGEVWWYYPSGDSEEVNEYVCYNYQENHWTFGTLARTAGVDRGVFLVPVAADSDGNIWKHETGTARPGADPIFAESGPVEIEDGNNVWMVRRIVPDETSLGTLRVLVGASFYPTDPVVFQGPYAPNQPTSVRLTARQMRFRLEESIADHDFRVGVFRIDVVQAGER